MKVVIGVDDSPESRHAVDTAFEFFGAEVDYVIASVGDRMPFYTASFAGGAALSSVDLAQQFDAAAHAARRTALDAASELPIQADVSVQVGHVGQALCDLAVDEGVDAIVIGSKDKTIWKRLLDPSVGRYLIDHAPCPVVVVR